MATTGTVEEASPPGGLLSGYVPPADGYDEMLAADGTVRPVWQRFVQGLEQLGATALGQRAEQARRLLRENGVTYNVFGAPQGPDRPWELDPLPLLIARPQWNELEAGLRQRATLLNLILADVYGRQQLVRRGLLPPKLLFGHSAFLLPCHGLSVPQDSYLHLYGCHLARNADGRWLVLADRTQGPSGAGFAVENRLVLSRLLPQDFQALHVERLAGFFITLRDTLLGMATRHRDNPRVVLLSPGPRSATYFEDGYLARYLGYTLVEGGDLTVRGGGVFLKTLGALLPVDVILRRVMDEDCDPLELRADALAGVTGLVHAARGGQVALANALGSGFLEAPALMAFLPKICQALLGEELRLPSVETWWCGHPADFELVRRRLSDLIIRPAFQHRAAQPIIGRQLTAAQREEVLAKIARRPGLYVAQAVVTRSTAPVWSQGALQPWRVGLRAFAVAQGDTYRVMPGGLSRVSSGLDFLGESFSAGQASKDVWILADGPVDTSTLLRPARAAVELRRSVNDLPSRAADNLFWLGRHVERAEGQVRHLRSIVVRLTNELDPAGWHELATLLHALADPADTPVELPRPGTWTPALLAELRTTALEFLFDERRAIGVASTLEALRHTASLVRDRLSIDCWRIVHQTDLKALFPGTAREARLGEVLLLLNQILNLLSAFSGLGMESMTRGPGWRFLDMGRRIERALHTLRLIKRTLVTARGELTPLLEAVLEIADSTMTYRYRYLTSLQLAPVLDLILVDETNPRAVGFQLSALADHVRNLPRDERESAYDREQRIMLAAQASLRLCDVDAFCHADSPGQRPPLARFLDELSAHLRHLSDAVTQRYLTHTGPSQQLGVFGDESAEEPV
ncbi:MAG: circularly permuted type 2 ATP-grasp protein [Pirellulales bacterium]